MGVPSACLCHCTALDSAVAGPPKLVVINIGLESGTSTLQIGALGLMSLFHTGHTGAHGRRVWVVQPQICVLIETLVFACSVGSTVRGPIIVYSVLDEVLGKR